MNHNKGNITVNPSVRVTQGLGDSGIIGSYMLYHSQNDFQSEIDARIYSILRDVNKGNVKGTQNLKILINRYCKNSENVYNFLLENHIVIEQNDFQYNPNILPRKKVTYPLTSLALELTNCCNLNCIHCYGQYGKILKPAFLSYDYIVSLKPTLDLLHTQRVALTGGEVLIRPDFEKIALFFLQNGFRVTIFTNGFHYQRLINFLEESKAYAMHIKISLDGPEAVHDFIRGREKSFENACKSLDALRAYPNVTASIATSVMKDNLEYAEGFMRFVKERYPDFEHQADIAFPIDAPDQQKRMFSESEFEEVYKTAPFLFSVNPQNRTFKHRCKGGVTGAALSADKKLRICSAASDPEFELGDLENEDLLRLWKSPHENGRKFRKEYYSCSPQCASCEAKKACNIINCRVLARQFTGNSINANPLGCFMMRRNYYENCNGHDEEVPAEV